MPTKHLLWLTPAVMVVLSVLAGSAPGDAPPDARQEEARDSEQFIAQMDEWVCNVRKTADFGSYCVYYAVYCPTMAARSWSNTNCNLAPGNCSMPTEPECEKLPAGAKKKKDKDEQVMLKGGHHVEPALQSKGLAKPKPANFAPTPAAKEIKIIANHLVNIEDGGGNKLRVRLFLLLVPKFGKHAQAVFGHGVEVESAGKADFDIPYDERVLTFSEKVCEVNLHGLNYNVILASQPQLRPGAAPAKDRAPKKSAEGGPAGAIQLVPANQVSQPCCGSAPVVIPAPRLFRGRLR
jgi:hypothetical protein